MKYIQVPTSYDDLEVPKGGSKKDLDLMYLDEVKVHLEISCNSTQLPCR